MEKNLLHELTEKGKITPPTWLADGVQFLAMMGSTAYGVAGESSDRDVYGWAIPPKHFVWPHLAGEIQGFGRHAKRFEQYQQHHIYYAKNVWDVTVFSIIKFFQLCMDNNPNIIDALFVPDRCVIFETELARLVRENRKIFLHKGSFHRFKGYAYSQLAKLDHTRMHMPKSQSRRESIQKHGYDTKFAYHLVRLLLEVEQILTEGDLQLDRHATQLRGIREGQWSLQQVKDFFAQKEADLEHVYNISTAVPYRPDEPSIKALLVEVLDLYFDSIPRTERDKTLAIKNALHDIKVKVDNALGLL